MTISASTIKKMSLEERWELLQLLWDSLNDAPKSLHPWQKKIIEVRLARMKSKPGQGIPWEEFSKEMEARYGAA